MPAFKWSFFKCQKKLLLKCCNWRLQPHIFYKMDLRGQDRACSFCRFLLTNSFCFVLYGKTKRCCKYFLWSGRAPWSCGLMHHVLDREVGCSNFSKGINMSAFFSVFYALEYHRQKVERSFCTIRKMIKWMVHAENKTQIEKLQVAPTYQHLFNKKCIISAANHHALVTHSWEMLFEQ